MKEPANIPREELMRGAVLFFMLALAASHLRHISRSLLFGWLRGIPAFWQLIPQDSQST